MDHRLRVLVSSLLLVSAVAAADDRFAVLEFFGRPGGTFCEAAAPAMTSLQNEMQGRAVLLEYDFDGYWGDRIDVFWATGSTAGYLPLVMVGSGYRTASGSVDYEPVYRGMIDAELARPPRARVGAYWRRSGNAMRLYVEVENSSGTELRVAEAAAVWVIAWENANIGVASTWVRSLARWALPSDLAPGEKITAVIDTGAMAGADWSRMAGLALVEDRPGGSGRFDMLQAAEALPTGFSVAPDRLAVGPGRPVAEVEVAGPHVLEWSATSDVPWLQVTPATGSGSANVTVTLLPELRPPSAVDGRITFDAAGDGMAFTTTVDVEVAGQVRRGGRRFRP